MMHHFCNNEQIHNQHQNDRYQRCFYKCLRIPDRFISRQTVTVIIHGNNYLFKYRIAKYISDHSRKQRDDHRHGKIMSDEFSSCIPRCPQCSDRGSLLYDRVVDCNCKDESDNTDQNIQKDTTHCFIRTHVLCCKGDRRIGISRYIVCNLIVRYDRLCQKCPHEII